MSQNGMKSSSPELHMSNFLSTLLLSSFMKHLPSIQKTYTIQICITKTTIDAYVAHKFHVFKKLKIKNQLVC
jgi:hypothetical protein